MLLHKLQINQVFELCNEYQMKEHVIGERVGILLCMLYKQILKNGPTLIQSLFFIRNSRVAWTILGSMLLKGITPKVF